MIMIILIHFTKILWKMSNKWAIWHYYIEHEAPLLMLQCSAVGNYKLLGAKEHNVPYLIPPDRYSSVTLFQLLNNFIHCRSYYGFQTQQCTLNKLLNLSSRNATESFSFSNIFWFPTYLLLINFSKKFIQSPTQFPEATSFKVLLRHRSLYGQNF